LTLYHEPNPTHTAVSNPNITKVSVLINMCVVCVFAAGFHTSATPPPAVGVTSGSVTSGVGGSDLDLGLQNAGEYLGRTYGGAIVLIWALGLLAAGQSSTMTGCYTGQFVMEGFLDWKVRAGRFLRGGIRGGAVRFGGVVFLLRRAARVRCCSQMLPPHKSNKIGTKIKQVAAWVRILVTRLVALVPTLAVAWLSGSAGRGGASTSLDKLNQVLNLLQSVQLPFA
jgi:natural resistance-associated macrophage protein